MLIMILPFLFIALITRYIFLHLSVLSAFRNVKIMSYISLAGNFFMIASIILIYAVELSMFHLFKDKFSN